MKKIIFLSIIQLFLLSALQAQIKIQCQVNKDTVDSGQDLLLSFNLDVDATIDIKQLSISVLDTMQLYQFLNPEDSSAQLTSSGIAAYEIKNFGQWMDSGSHVISGNMQGVFPRNAKGKISNTMTLTFWDTGDFLIFIDEILYQKEGEEIQSFYPDLYHARAIHVPAPIQVSDQDSGLAPGKENKWEGWHLLDFKWLFIALLIILLAIWLIRRTGRKKRKENSKEVEQKIQRPAHSIAFEKLDDLHKRSLWQEGKIKEYQSSLTYIVREYLENRYGIKALESTTTEIMNDLEKLDLEKEDLIKMDKILQIADLVKFAKAKPEVNIHEAFFQDAVAFVRNTKLKSQNNSTEQ